MLPNKSKRHNKKRKKKNFFGINKHLPMNK